MKKAWSPAAQVSVYSAIVIPPGNSGAPAADTEYEWVGESPKKPFDVMNGSLFAVLLRGYPSGILF